MDFAKLIFRQVKEGDLAAIVVMLASDVLGSTRENPNDLQKYRIAFQEISADKNNFLAVVEFENRLIGTCHLTIMPSLPLQGSKRMNIESVRVVDEFSNCGIGSWMMQKAIEFAKKHEVKIVQLTSNKSRIRAHKFYEKLGFEKSHEGMKLKL